MKSMNQKRWLALAFLCLAPISAFAGQEKPKPRNHHERPAASGRFRSRRVALLWSTCLEPGSRAWVQC